MTYQTVKDREDDDLLDDEADEQDQDGEKSGSRLIAEDIAAQVRRDAYATAFRLRRQLMPHAITCAVLGSGLAAHAVCASGSAQPAAVATILMMTGFPVAVGIWAKVRKTRRRWARRVLIGGLGAAAWLTVAPFGVGPEHAAVLVGFEVAVAARWWQTVRIGYPGPAIEEPELAVPRVPSTAEEIMADWAEFNACDNGPAARSVLTNPEPTEHTIAFDLGLWRGRQTIATVRDKLDKIATGLDLGVQDLVLEEHPTKSDAWCRLQVITNSPIQGAVDFDGPRRRGGILELGPYADGSGEAPYRLYTDGSMWSGFILGGTGIGKSRVVENIVISALSGGDTDYWYLDPARGGSSPALAEHADFFATMDNADDMLDAAIAGLNARTEENAYEGWTGFTPSRDRPGLLIVVEECHNVFADQKRVMEWARIAREGRKVGISLLCVSQYPGLETFGTKEALRSSVMEGNALVMRVTSNSAGQMMAGLRIDPKTLPKIAGYAYVQGSEEAGIRTAPFRNRNTDPDRTGKAASGFLAAQPRPGLDMLFATATLSAGTTYRDRRVVEARTASGALIEALRAGRLPDGAFRKAAEAVRAVVSDLGQIIAFPSPLTLEDLQRPAAEATAPDGLTASQRAVLDAVSAGASRPTEVESATGLRHRRVAELLKELVADGHLVQPSYGRYQRAA